jgi:hypothetical protein
MAPNLQDVTYVLRRQVLSLKLFVAACRGYDSSGELCFVGDQKGSGLRHDLRLYADERQQEEVLAMTARELLGFSVAIDVVDSRTQQKVGALRRRGLESMLRDKWVILDAEDAEVGVIKEDNEVLALVRRFATSLIPQSYQVLVDDAPVGVFTQNFNPLAPTLTLDFSADPDAKALDRRLGIAAGVLMFVVEGRQR